MQLVPLHSAAERDICEALALPRVGVIGIRFGAPNIEGLLALLKDVPLVEVPFLEQASAGQWLGTKVELSGAQDHNVLSA
jgi:hypothetical protein